MYSDLLADVEEIVLPEVLEDNQHVWHLFVIQVPSAIGSPKHLRRWESRRLFTIRTRFTAFLRSLATILAVPTWGLPSVRATAFCHFQCSPEYHRSSSIAWSMRYGLNFSEARFARDAGRIRQFSSLAVSGGLGEFTLRARRRLVRALAPAESEASADSRGLLGRTRSAILR